MQIRMCFGDGGKFFNWIADVTTKKRKSNNSCHLFSFRFFWVARIQLCIQYRDPEKKKKNLVWKKMWCIVTARKSEKSCKKIVKMWTVFFMYSNTVDDVFFSWVLLFFKWLKRRIIFHSGGMFFLSPSFLQQAEAFARTIWLFYFLGRFAKEELKKKS